MTATTMVRTPDGRILASCQWGPPGGTPVFALHGTPGGRLLRAVRGEYERVAARAITYDRPGYGGSDRLPGRTVAHAAADIAVIADHLGLDRFSVVGVSGGGPHALAAAAGLPERVSRCATIVGLAPFDAPGLDFSAGMGDEFAEQWRRYEREGEELLTGADYRAILAFVESMDELEGVPTDIRDMLQQSVRDALAPGPYGYSDDVLSFLAPWGFDLADIRCPTTVMVATDDEEVPRAHGEWITAHVPGAVLLEVPGDHLGPRADAEEQLLGWAASG